MMSDFRAKYNPLTQDQLDVIKDRMDERPGTLQDPVIVCRLLATLDQQQAAINNLVTENQLKMADAELHEAKAFLEVAG